MCIVLDSFGAAVPEMEISDASKGLARNVVRCLPTVFDDSRHPYAILNELHQKRILSTLQHDNLGQRDGDWCARVTLSSVDMQLTSLSIEKWGGSKAQAKLHASKDLLWKLRDGMLMLSIYSVFRLCNSADDNPVVSSQMKKINPTEIEVGDQNSGSFLSHHSATTSAVPPEALLSEHSTFTKKQLRLLEVAETHLSKLREMHEMGDAVAIPPETTCHTTIISVDVEWHECSRNKMLEFGLAWTHLLNNRVEEAKISVHHLIVQDNYDIRNGKWVPDNKDNFRFGTSERVSLADVPERLHDIMMSVARRSGRVYLIGHSVHADIAVLNSLGFVDPIAGKLAICDIAKAFQARYRHKSITGLSKLLDYYGIEFDHLHNAANDAFFTLLLCLRMMSHEQA